MKHYIIILLLGLGFIEAQAMQINSRILSFNATESANTKFLCDILIYKDAVAFDAYNENSSKSKQKKPKPHNNSEIVQPNPARTPINSLIIRPCENQDIALKACIQKINRRKARAKKEKFVSDNIVKIPTPNLNKLLYDQVNTEETALRNASYLLLSNHAKRRMEERGITKEQIAQAVLYGKHISRGEGCIKCIYKDKLTRMRYALVCTMNAAKPYLITCYRNKLGQTKKTPQKWFKKNRR